MTQNINVKKDAKPGLRKAMVPVGIIAGVAGFLWIFFDIIGWALTEKKIGTDLLKAGRYIAIPFAFLALALAALMIAHAILQLVKLNKSNIKWEITSGIINAIVGLLMLIFFILVVTKVFKEENWFDSDVYKTTAFMGILTALSVYITAFGKNFSSAELQGKNTNIKTMRCIAVAALIIALCNILAVGLTALGGFNKIGDTNGKTQDFIASSFAAKFALGALGVIALGMLCMIPLAILGINDKAAAKKNIILWSVLGGIAFVLFVIPAAMMSLKNGSPTKWGDDHTVITVFILLAEIYSIVAAGIASVKTKTIAPAKAAATAA